MKLGVSRKQISALHLAGVVERVHADTYRMTAVAASSEQRLRAALLWAGNRSAAAGRSGGELYGLEGVRAITPEIVLPRSQRKRTASVLVHGCDQWPALMVREWRGLRVTGVESTLTMLALALEDEALEIACEDARRRKLTSIPALRDIWRGSTALLVPAPRAFGASSTTSIPFGRRDRRWR